MIDTSTLKVVSKGIRKKDYKELVTGNPVFTEDIASPDALTVKLLRSPLANAIVKEIDASAALKVPGVVAVYTWKDVPNRRFTLAGQDYPEASPYDRLIIDRHLRYVGDVVAIIAARSAESAEKAVKLIKATYDALEPVLDFKKALDNPSLVHTEDDWSINFPQGEDVKRNLICHELSYDGDVDAVLTTCDELVDETYYTCSDNQSMMETFRTYSYMEDGRLVILSSTQIPFHIQRIVASVIGIDKEKVRVVKPKVGGGFGAKQVSVSDIYTAWVTWNTGLPALLVFDRTEAMTCGCPRHEMQIRIRMGADKDGRIRAIEMQTLSNGGAYGEHSTTTMGLTGHKAISMYGSLEAYRFDAKAVYTNLQPAGAFRGFGATQGIHAVESAVDELAHKLGIDPCAIREMNMVREGQVMPSYYNEVNTSCNLDKCLARVKEMVGWESNYPRKVLENGHIRSVGIAMSMQGSSIAGIDVGGAKIRLAGDGKVHLLIGATDMGTGCDTTLAQIAAEALGCGIDDVITEQVDTDRSPYDSGSYASSTAFLTGKAVYKCAVELLTKCKDELAGGAELGIFEYDEICRKKGLTIEHELEHQCPNSPPPFMVGAAIIDIDPATGRITPVEYDAVVDCGTILNPNLVRVQTEGGIVQGLGMALYEDVSYTDKGQVKQRNFLQYKIPSRMDICPINVEFAPSYEEQGPYGAKSIGEVVINTVCPSIANALENACGVRIRQMPLTPEKVWKALQSK